MQYNPPDDLPLRVRTMQIIDAALVMGLLSFLLIVTVILPGKPVALGVLPLLTLIALGFAAAMIVVRVIVVNIVTIAGRRRIGPPDATGRPTAGARDGTTEQLLALYQTRMIVGAACLEGPAFFLLITYMTEHSPWSLAAAIVLILGIAAHFPTQQRIADFVQQQISQMEEEKY
jgi:hypothetical protein